MLNKLRTQLFSPLARGRTMVDEPQLRLSSEDAYLAQVGGLSRGQRRGTLIVPYRASDSVHDYRLLAEKWLGPVILEMPDSALSERVSYLRKDGFDVRICFPHRPDLLPKLGAHSSGLHLLKDVRQFAGAGRVEFAVELDHDAFWLLPLLVFQAGRFKPTTISVKRLSERVDAATVESAKVASLEAKGMGFSVNVAGL